MSKNSGFGWFSFKAWQRRGTKTSIGEHVGRRHLGGRDRRDAGALRAAASTSPPIPQAAWHLGRAGEVCRRHRFKRQRFPGGSAWVRGAHTQSPSDEPSEPASGRKHITSGLKACPGIQPATDLKPSFMQIHYMQQNTRPAGIQIIMHQSGAKPK